MRILLYTVWYGEQFPNYLPTWLKSIRHLEGVVDFVFITEAHPGKHYYLPSNLIVKLLSFDDLQEQFVEKVGSAPMYPYKLCDYKPMYGHVFESFLTSEYDYWGYCDLDTVFGDVRTFLQNILYLEYDRIGAWGHFVILKNNERMKYLYRTNMINDADKYHHYQYLATTTYPCHFDEIGLNLICKYEKLRFFEEPLVFNTIGRVTRVHTFQCRNTHELLTWENGHTYRYYLLNSGDIVKDEQMYIHYGVQKNMPQLEELGDSFFLTKDGFRHFDPSKIDLYLKEYGAPDSSEEHKIVSKEWTRWLHDNRKIRMKRELDHFGYYIVLKNILTRIPKVLKNMFKYGNF